MTFNYANEWYDAAADRAPGASPYLSLYVITFNPTDHPGLYVVRRHEALPGGPTAREIMGTAQTLAEAREHIPAGLVRLDRDRQDDPVIVESWL